MRFTFDFLFDGNCEGTKTYTGSLLQCAAQFNKDVISGALPSVNNLIAIKNVTQELVKK
jgi:hypothetical protein